MNPPQPQLLEVGGLSRSDVFDGGVLTGVCIHILVVLRLDTFCFSLCVRCHAYVYVYVEVVCVRVLATMSFLMTS